MISIFGLGFVGITTALYFAEKKNMIVYGIDVDKKKSDKLSEKKLPFYEPKLENILKKQLNSNFFLSSNIKIDINRSKYIFTSQSVDKVSILFLFLKKWCIMKK